MRKQFLSVFVLLVVGLVVNVANVTAGTIELPTVTTIGQPVDILISVEKMAALSLSCVDIIWGGYIMGSMELEGPDTGRIKKVEGRWIIVLPPGSHQLRLKIPGTFCGFLEMKVEGVMDRRRVEEVGYLAVLPPPPPPPSY